MKKCKHCQTEIDDKAKICPNCRKKQGMPIWLIVVLVIVVVSIISAIGGSSESNEEKPSGETVEDLALLDGYSGKAENEYSYEIKGTIKNNTDEEYSYVSVEFYVYDKDGNMLDTCLGNNSGLEANGTWKFTASCFFGDGDAKKVSSYKLKEVTGW